MASRPYPGGDRPPRRGGRVATGVKRGNFILDIRGIPLSGSWQDLKDHFRHIGDIGYADVWSEGGDATEKCGELSFFNRRDLEEAISRLDGSTFKSHEGEKSRISVKEKRVPHYVQTGHRGGRDEPPEAYNGNFHRGYNRGEYGGPPSGGRYEQKMRSYDRHRSMSPPREGYYQRPPYENRRSRSPRDRMPPPHMPYSGPPGGRRHRDYGYNDNDRGPPRRYNGDRPRM